MMSTYAHINRSALMLFILFHRIVYNLFICMELLLLIRENVTVSLFKDIVVVLNVCVCVHACI